MLSLDIDTLITDALTPDRIKDYLNIVARMPHMPYVNSLRIWAQMPTSTCVAGLNGWRRRGIEVTDKSQPIHLIKPAFDMISDADDELPIARWQYRYDEVVVYDISATDDNEDTTVEVDVMDAVRRHGYTVYLVDKADIPDHSGCCYADGFYINKALADKEQAHSLLTCYANMLVAEEDSNLLPLLTYVLEMRYCHNITAGTFRYLNALSDNEAKKKLLASLSHWTSIITQQIEGCVLTFNETAIVNYLLSDDKQEICDTLTDVAEAVDDEALSAEIRGLRDKLIKCTGEELADINDDRLACKIITYPHYKIGGKK